MKKLLMLILSLSMATVALTSCDALFGEPTSSSSSPAAPITSVEEPTESSKEEAKKEYTVTFQQAGQTDVTFTVKEGEKFTDIPDPVQEEGYTTVWSATDLAKLTKVNGNVTVMAEKTANTYTITFEAGEGVTFPATKVVTYDAQVTLSSPERQGYTFGGWVIKGTQTQVMSGIWEIADDVTLTAVWTKNAAETVKVTFIYSGNQSVVKTVEKGTALTDIPAFPDDAGYEYSWSVTDFSNITEDMTVTLNAVAKTFVVTYNANGGEITEGAATQTVTYGEAYTLEAPTATNEGFDFIGWEYREGTLPTGVWNLLTDITLYATWVEKSADKVTINFVDNKGVSLKVVTINVGETLPESEIPTLPVQDGYTFAWDTALDGAFTESVTIKAVPTANDYTITYDANGGNITAGNATQTVTYDSAYALSYPEVSREGYTLVEWTAVEYELPMGVWTIANNVTIQAQWAKEVTYTISFVQAGQETKTFTVKEGESFTAIPTPAQKVGYTVVWQDVDLTNVTSNITVNAIETAKMYTVQLNADGGTGAAIAFTVNYDEKITLDIPSKVGYNFLGWYDGDTLVAKDAEIQWKYDNEGMTLTAKWEAKTYTVTWKGNGGTVDGQTEVTVQIKTGETYSKPQFKREGYVLVGWKQNNTTVTLSDVWTLTGAGDTVVLTAVWQQSEDGNWTQNY